MKQGGARVKSMRRSTMKKLKHRQILRQANNNGTSYVRLAQPLSLKFGSVRRGNPRNKKARSRSAVSQSAKTMMTSFRKSLKSHTKNREKKQANDLSNMMGRLGF